MLPIESVRVCCIVANKFNPNVMQDEEYQALKKDMLLHGPEGVDPVLVSPYDLFYISAQLDSLPECFVIVDGEHRFAAAKELGWNEIRCEIREVDEEEAKGICYRKNKDRGSIDPFKEAALFKSEVDLGLGQKQIAEKFLVDPSTVSHRLSLLKLAPEIVKQVSMMPRGTVTPSHLEPIASLPEGEQKKIKIKNEWDHQEVKSVRELSEEAKRIKEHLVEQLELKAALEGAKFPKCPKCKQEPGHIDSSRKLPFVRCSSGSWDHVWSLETGKDIYYDERVEQKKISGEKSEPVRTSVIRSTHTVNELSDVFAERLKEMVPKMQRISSFSIRGKLEDGEGFSANFSGYGNSMSVSVHLGHDFFFSAEQKEYRSGEKSKVNSRSPEYVERTKLFIENAFQGKLEVPTEERVKGPIPAAADLTEKEDVDLEVPCLDCQNDSENGGNCHRERFCIDQENGGYSCKTKNPLSGEELAKISVDAEIEEALGQ